MRLMFRDWKGRNPAELAFDQKIQGQPLVDKLWPLPRPGIYIRKTMRIIDMTFSCELLGHGRHVGYLTLTESEALWLASLCRRGRSDEAFLKAIAKAGTERPTRRKARRPKPAPL